MSTSAARAIDHRSAPLNALAVVAGLLVGADPLAVADPAFVLTFGATLAILIVVPVLHPVLARPFRQTAEPAENAEHADKRKARSKSPLDYLRVVGVMRQTGTPRGVMFAASVAAEALLFPVAALVFSRVTFAGLALNFLAIPMMGVAQLAGMAVVPLAVVSRRAAGAAGWIAHLGAAGLVASADLVRFAPALTYRLAPPAAAAVVAYYAAAGVGWTLWRRRVDTMGSSESGAVRVLRRASIALALFAAGLDPDRSADAPRLARRRASARRRD